MNIAIDIDDMLTNSFDYFLPYVAEYFDENENELRRKNISYGNLPEAWKEDEIGCCKTYYDHVVVDTPFKPDAAWGISTLRERWHKIIIITGRTTAFYMDPYKTTAEELAKGGIVYDKLICTLDKVSACIAENISVLIDDLTANCTAATKNGIRAIMFSSKGNANIKTEHPRVSDWASAIQAVAQLEQN